MPSVGGLSSDIISKEATAVSTDQQDVAKSKSHKKYAGEKKACKDFFHLFTLQRILTFRELVFNGNTLQADAI